jgi:glutaminyl-peptide cyclotransferase
MANKKISQTRRTRSSARLWIGVVLVIIVVGAAVFFFQTSQSGQMSKSTPPPEKSNASGPARSVAYQVINSYPHDPAAFLQGLVWYDGRFFESTGLYGESTLREVEFPSGKVLRKINLPPNLFGEGLALVGDRLIQLEWKTGRGFVYDRDTFKLLREFKYHTEGWGITYDGTSLIMSDGSSELTFLDPQTFEPTRKLTVRMNGKPMTELNELEYIEGEVWANVWQTDVILRIDPGNGEVTSFLDLKGLLPPMVRTGNEDVLNGIAYDARDKRIFLSGKKWPRIFEIKLKQ